MRERAAWAVVVVLALALGGCIASLHGEDSLNRTLPEIADYQPEVRDLFGSKNVLVTYVSNNHYRGIVVNDGVFFLFTKDIVDCFSDDSVRPKYAGRCGVSFRQRVVKAIYHKSPNRFLSATHSQIVRRCLPEISNINCGLETEFVRGFDNLRIFNANVGAKLTLSRISRNPVGFDRSFRGRAVLAKRVTDEYDGIETDPRRDNSEYSHKPLSEGILRKKPPIKWADPKMGIILIMVLFGTFLIGAALIASAIIWLTKPRESPNEEEEGDGGANS